MRLGVTRYGPVAPEACQLGKYETFTRTGVPTFDTWKLTALSPSWTLVTVVDFVGRRGGWVSPILTRGQEGGPLWASSTFQRDGSSYQLAEGPSHEFCPAPIP